ncbi:hypothetical protein BVRB_6g129280 [Beta vulgaris subsp. vulgaris]|nr:hypothetical protein BVRB_6g129280 [Beta vulgaris subsp. vulgaris]
MINGSLFTILVMKPNARAYGLAHFIYVMTMFVSVLILADDHGYYNSIISSVDGAFSSLVTYVTSWLFLYY